MNQNPVRWFEIYVQDMARAKTFYETVFGATLEKLDTMDMEMWSFPMQMDQMGCGGALVRMPGVPSAPGGTLVYFGCQDCAVEEARAVASGGRVARSKFSIGRYGFISLIFDTEGNMIGLHSLQ